MRLAPVVLFYYPSHHEIAKFTVASSCTTHSAPEATECCQLLGELIAKALSGKPKAEILGSSQTVFSEDKVRSIAAGEYMLAASGQGVQVAEDGNGLTCQRYQVLALGLRDEVAADSRRAGVLAIVPLCKASHEGGLADVGITQYDHLEFGLG